MGHCHCGLFFKLEAQATLELDTSDMNSVLVVVHFTAFSWLSKAIWN
jgi:hypothetical protein